MELVAPDVYTFTGLIIGRVYLLKDSDGLTILDAGIPPAGKRILAQLAEAGHSASDIKRILITHAHPDHVGAIPELQKASGATLIVPKGEQAVINGQKEIPRAAGRIRPPKTILKDMHADKTIADGDILGNILGGLHAIHTPGHAPGHMAYWHPERRILFTGDAIFNMRKMTLPWGFLTVDPAQNMRSIARLAQFEPETICFGHGEPITRDATDRLRAFAVEVGAV